MPERVERRPGARTNDLPHIGVAGAGGWVVPRPLFPPSRAHLAEMIDDVGIWQHARGSRPDPAYGYCTDDVARLLVLDVLHARLLPPGALTADIRRSLAFLEAAFDPARGRFRNFRGADLAWAEAGASEDCHARALAGLAAVVAANPAARSADDARRLFERGLPATAGFGSLRPIARTIEACDTMWDAGLGWLVLPAYRAAVEKLTAAFDAAEGEDAGSWPWPEPAVTYENALLPHALILAGGRFGRPALIARGCAALDWLAAAQTGVGGVFSPIGNRGWWPRGGARSRFDQQPIEATTTICAASAALAATGLVRYRWVAEWAYGWFLGDNDVRVEVADPPTGACHDGLLPAGVNRNQGAESTLMWLIALERIRELRGDPATKEPGRPAAPAIEMGVSR